MKNVDKKVIIVINAGSSSIKYKIFKKSNDEVIASGQIEKIGNPQSIFVLKYGQKKISQNLPIPNHKEGIQKILNELKNNKIIVNTKDIYAIGHRVVMGGISFNKSTIWTPIVKKHVVDFFSIAPLHNPPEVQTIDVFEKILPNVKNVCVFDTSFHRTIPTFNHYPLDQKVVKKYKIYKYGMHGTSYRFVTEKMKTVLKKKNINLIICHLGNGASICEVVNSKSLNTTMGLSPLEGLMMGTRSGDIDPSIVTYLIRQGYSVDKVDNLLNKESGFKGMTGYNDCRDVEDKASKGNKNAILALNMFISRIVKYVTTYANEILVHGKINGIVFTAGIGENSKFIIKKIVEKLPILNLKLNEKKLNEQYSDWKLISDPKSKIKMYQVHTNEELMIEQDVKKLVK